MNSTESLLAAPQDSFILVVDDLPKNIQVVGAILSEAGYEVMPATSGPQALERAQGRLPDLILLDLMMPEMDGLEVCRRFQANPVTHDIPVLFLTASNELDHLVQAFRVGAVDYVTKPFNANELLARVRTHLELKQTRDAWRTQTRRLQALDAEKNEFLGIAAHDLRNPLHNILALAAALRDEPALDSDETKESLDLILRSAEHMLQLVENLLDINRIEQGKLTLDPGPCSLAELVAASVESFSAKAQAKAQALRFQRPAEPLIANVDAGATLQVVDNLISNAIKYSPPGKTIQVRLGALDGHLRLEVQDQGPGLSDADKTRLFGKFARLSARPTGGEVSVGLGLSIVKSMVEACQGRVWCDSQAGRGATFIVEWPRALE